MSPFDSYFSSAVREKDRKAYSKRHNERWRAFSMMSWVEQGKVIEGLVQRRGKLTKSQEALVRRWEEREGKRL